MSQSIQQMTVIRNIRQAATPVAAGTRVLRGRSMRRIETIDNAAIVVRGVNIEWIGKNTTIPSGYLDNAQTIDATGLVALPGFVDMHTHLVFGATREAEFSMRCSGASYQEIAEQGGGIQNTVGKTRAADKSLLLKKATKYLDSMLRHGTTTVEIKSGYGLTERDEIKILEVVRALQNDHPSTIVATFLGAHAIPREFAENTEGYIALIIERMIPYVASKNLSAFCDVFCENGYFSREDSRRILDTGRRYGLTPKIHADELSPSGGAELALEVGAVSADHLEYIDDITIEKFGRSDVVAGLLPGVSFNLGHAYAPARKLIDAGAAVALATDFNPGSCMSYSVPLMMTIACTQMKMTPEEALTASTLNAAAALNLSDTVGSLEPGKRADIALLRIPGYTYLPYHFGENHVAAVVKDGIWLEYGS